MVEIKRLEYGVDKQSGDYQSQYAPNAAIDTLIDEQPATTIVHGFQK